MARRTANPKIEDLLTIREVCDIYRVSRPTIYRWHKDGLIDLWKVGANTRVDRNQIEKRVIRRVAS